MSLVQRPTRRLLFVLVALSLVASACGSSGDSAVDEAASDPAASAAPTAVQAPEPTSPPADPVATSIPVPEDDAAADDAIAGLDAGDPPEATADPAENTVTIMRNVFNIDPDEASVDCIVGQAAFDSDLDTVLRNPNAANGDLDDAQLRGLAYGVNGCADAVALSDWATQAVGPQGDVRETAPACFSTYFADQDRGDLTFFTFVALTFQFRLDPTGSDSLVNALAECTPITSLGEFFAGQAEQTSGFNEFIDRDCLTEQLSDDEVNRGFWEIFVSGGQPPVSYITEFTDQCVLDAPVDERAAAIPADFVAWSGTGSLAGVAPAARANAYSSPPPMSIDSAGSYTAVLATGGGEVRIELFADSAPMTVNNFVSLARDGYYDGTVFHRVLEEFMAQGGDPTGTGTGGPGYQFGDEVDGGPALDRKGLLAMANAGPGTNGSQFFITFVATEWLTGNHTVFGEVTEGMDIVEAIQLRDPAAPTGPGQVIESVTIIEG